MSGTSLHSFHLDLRPAPAGLWLALGEIRSKAERVVASPEVTRLNPALARLYARKTLKTVSRDLHALRDLGLIELSRAGDEPAGSSPRLPASETGANPAPPK